MSGDATALGQAVVIGQCVSCLVLTGVALVVQVVVYPGLRTAGRAAPGSWRLLHAEHSRRITLAVGPPWLVQGVTCAALLGVRPSGVPRWEGLLACGFGLATVLLTLGWAIPLHTRLADRYDDSAARSLLWANGARLLAWAGAGALSIVLVLAA